MNIYQNENRNLVDYLDRVIADPYGDGEIKEKDIRTEVYWAITAYQEMSEGKDYLFYDHRGIKGLNGQWIVSLAGDLFSVAHEWLSWGNLPKDYKIGEDGNPYLVIGDWVLSFGKDKCALVFDPDGEELVYFLYQTYESDMGLRVTY